MSDRSYRILKRANQWHVVQILVRIPRWWWFDRYEWETIGIEYPTYMEAKQFIERYEGGRRESELAAGGPEKVIHGHYGYVANDGHFYSTRDHD